MASARKIVIEFLGKDTSLSRTAKTAGDNTSKLGSRMAAVGKVGAVALAGGVAIAAKGMWEAGKAAAADEQQQKLLATAMKNSAGASKGQIAATEKWISAQGRALGVTDEKLRPSLSSLVRATGDVGQAQKLAALSMDVSAGSGKDLEAVSMAMAKAANGNVGALGRLGIATKNADGTTKSFAQIQKDLANHFGGAAQAKANTFQGKMDRLKLVMDETKEAIGARLLPIVTKMGEWFLNKGLPALEKFGGFLRDTFGPAIETIRGVISKVFGGEGGGAIAGWVSTVSGIFQNAISIWQSLWGLFGGTLTTLFKALWGNVKQIIGGALQVISGVFKIFAGILKGDWSMVWEGVKQVVKGAWSIIKGIVNAGWNGIKAVFKAAGTVLKSVFSGIWNAIKSVAKKAWNDLVADVKRIPGRLRAIGGLFKSAGSWLIKAFISGIGKIGSTASEFARKIWSAVKGVLNAGIRRLNSLLEFTVAGVRINPRNIPQLERGGIVPARRGGTLVNVGEGGHPEAVIPLSGPHAPAIASASGGSGDTYIFNINGVVGPRDELMTFIVQGLTRRKRLTGQPLGLS